MLEWVKKDNLFISESNKSPTGTFRILFDGKTYWASWTTDSNDDLNFLKHEAQKIHEEL